MFRLAAALAISIALHLILLAFKFASPRLPENPSPIEIEIQETKSPSPPEQVKPSNHKSKGNQTHTAKHFRVRQRLRALLSRKDVTFETGSLASTQDFTNEGERGLAEGDWGSHAGDLKQLGYFNQYNKIFEELQNMLNYPGILCQHGFSGTVNSRIYFDEHGRCDWPRSKIGGAHPYLRVYSLSLLKKLCSFDSVKQLKIKPPQFVDISFNFNVVSLPQTEKEQASLDRLHGNAIMLYRSCFRPPHQIELGPITLDPISQMGFINFPWLFENWDRYVEGKDPFREFKEP